LCWGSFQLLAGRRFAVNNAFDMLRPGGNLVIMDVYPPDIDMIERYIGAEQAKKIAFIMRPFAMGESLQTFVCGQWMLRMKKTALSDTDAIEIPAVIPLSHALPGGSEMQCLCFTKPEMPSKVAVATVFKSGTTPRREVQSVV
jgi:hypothetical protein